MILLTCIVGIYVHGKSYIHYNLHYSNADISLPQLIETYVSIFCICYIGVNYSHSIEKSDTIATNES